MTLVEVIQVAAVIPARDIFMIIQKKVIICYSIKHTIMVIVQRLLKPKMIEHALVQQQQVR